MSVPVFIGDRLTASGFRLAGVRPLLTAPDEALAAFREALKGDAPVLITAPLAECLPAALLDAAVAAAAPPVTVVPVAGDGAMPPDMARRVRHALGVET